MKKIIFIIIGAITLFMFYGLFSEITKKKPKKRVACQEKTITFEKIHSKALAKEAVELLKNSAYTLTGKVDYSVHMKSHLVTILSAEDLNLLIQQVIEEYTTSKNESANKLDKTLEIHYILYENDKEDKNKKNPDAKLYAGQIGFEFKLDNKLIYKIQTDYMNLDAKDLKERVKCAIDSFVSI